MTLTPTKNIEGNDESLVMVSNVGRQKLHN